jgi:coenzyme F420-0:L-glutamate ligase/coenzyme F420-1:gamma-L-glutamate ligase
LRRLDLIGVEGLPEINLGDDLADLIGSRTDLMAGDVVVVAQKVVSKAEGRTRNLAEVTAGKEAIRLAPHLVAAPDPRFVQVVLDESVRVLRTERVLITETRHGFVCANSGVDHSNIPGSEVVTLLPIDPDASAERLRDRLREITGVTAGVIVSDTFGRPWRLGIVNVALGVAGMPALLDMRGRLDDAGKELRATVLAVADEVAAAAGLVMEKTGQLVVPRLVGELGGGPVEVGDDALGDELVDRVVEASLAREHVVGAQLGRAFGDEAPEHAPQDQELSHDLARGEAVRFALARVVARLCGERAATTEPLRLRVDELPRELDDEGRHVPELSEAPEPLERRDLVLEEPLLDRRHRQVPGSCLDPRGQLFERDRRCARTHHPHD